MKGWVKLKKKLRLFSAVMVLILCFSLFPKVPTVSAHEIHCDPVTGKVTFKKWWPRSDDLRAYIKVNTQLAKDPQVKRHMRRLLPDCGNPIAPMKSKWIPTSL